MCIGALAISGCIVKMYGLCALGFLIPNLLTKGNMEHKNDVPFLLFVKKIFLFVYSAVNILSITLFHAFGYASDFFLGFICRYVAVSP